MSNPSHTAAAHINALARKHYPKRKTVISKPSSIQEAEAMGSVKGGAWPKPKDIYNAGAGQLPT